jgi:hypothetical protein
MSIRFLKVRFCTGSSVSLAAHQHLLLTGHGGLSLNIIKPYQETPSNLKVLLKYKGKTIFERAGNGLPIGIPMPTSSLDQPHAINVRAGK